jgi:hypothetical protein
MGPVQLSCTAQNPSQSAAWLKPACDWATCTFGKFGGSRQSSVEIALRWPENRTVVLTEISVRFHRGHTHTPKGSASSANKISLGKYENSVCHVASTVAVKIDYH